MLVGHQTWLFNNKPTIISTGTVGGPFEARGSIPNDFDLLHDDTWLKQASFEKAQQVMMEEACQVAIKKSGLDKEQVNFFIGGDLINQITPTSLDRKSTRLNSSHVAISYAVFCLKKKKKHNNH